jgi:hypothetical protein
MKLTQKIIRQIITEEIKDFLSEETSQEQEESAVATISGILIRLDAANINAEQVLNKARDEFQDNKNATKNEQQEGNGLEIREEWSDADHDKQERIAKEIEKENPGISKEKKMAFAGAQVNREKRKRNK